MRRVVVTGGAGFIGSWLVRRLLSDYPDYQVVVLDALTYAGRRENLAAIESQIEFVHGDVRDRDCVRKTLAGATDLLHLAAETHVDRSIVNPDNFVTTDVYGTYVLLEASREIERFVYVSTDEVYGSIEEGEFTEESPLRPNSPYAASKASADLMCRAFFVTYDLPAIVTRGSNTFGPRQYPEKVLPLFVSNAIEGKPLPLYGDGRQRRDWLYVDDHCSGILTAWQKGKPGEAYNIGGGNERENIEIARRLLTVLGKPESLIKSVADRPGHDRRYALNSDKLKALGWAPKADFESAFEETVRWYAENRDWWKAIKERQPEFKQFADAWYKDRA
ncbi:MAG: dTDP-glucose 4,6-dehydratase [Armatimonadetes bacterium]|nr:dTDP-glucose 4,6-dehydratase [Armatimonadota bacterium]